MQEYPFFQCRTLKSNINQNLYERYKVNYIESVDINSRITIRCATVENARELERKLQKDFIQIRNNMPGKVIQILPISRENFMDLVTAGDDSYIAKEQQKVLSDIEKSKIAKYQV